MKAFIKNNGFSLIEEIISLAILSIIVIGFLPIIANSISNIYVSGNRTKNVSTAENMIGNAIKNNSTTNVVVQTNQTIIITLKNSAGVVTLSPASIQGKIITFNKSSSNQTTLSTFVPN